MYEELKDYLFNKDIPKTFHYYKFGLCIIATVEGVEDKGEGLDIKFAGGMVTIWDDSRVIRVSRPPNLIRRCEYCYSLHNEYDEPIGYIFN
jgi:hypothetical protein